MSPKTYTLVELAAFVRRVFALNLPEAVWVQAEIAQASISRGHCWLTLVEKGEESDQISAQLEAVCWATSLHKIRADHGTKLVREVLQEGMSVRLRVRADFHQRYGLKLIVEDLDATYTLGKLEQEKQRILVKLQEEGLLDLNARQPLSVTPQRLAVISSETAAGWADFQEQLRDNAYGYRFSLRLFSAAMQGVQTGPEVSRRIRQINRVSETFDAIVIIRGGGGRMDLAAFDDEDLAREIAGSQLPVIVGIGHETDESIADRVANTSLKTPTATAVFLIQRMMQAEVRLLQLGRGIGRAAGLQLLGHTQSLEEMEVRINVQARTALERESVRLDQANTALKRLADQNLRQAKQQLDQYAKLLAVLNPETTLARGFSILSQDGKLITSVGEIRPGPLQARLRDGDVELNK
ncbi:exodeoxyribonuclease VII large subunit [Lewinella sp. W8]|uniref:exodeoxyribonuclease VII large subunit n=1 Tax=Lewinella sp. W8 TaxID=2528208 RepID=UPI001566BA17